MKESEAKTKWCPMSRLVIVTNDEKRNVVNSSSFNRNSREGTGEVRFPNGSQCIGSDCMLWEGNYELEMKMIDVSQEVPEGWLKTGVGFDTEREIYTRKYLNSGHCGLTRNVN